MEACHRGGGGDGDRGTATTAYMALHGFTAVNLGYQPGNAVSNLVNKMDEPAFAATYGLLQSPCRRGTTSMPVKYFNEAEVVCRFPRLAGC